LLVLAAVTFIGTIFHVVSIFFGTQGAGKVVERTNVKNSGYTAILETGERVRFPPTELWKQVKVEDFLEKRRFSFSYRINGRDFNIFISLLELIIHWSLPPILLFTLGFPICARLHRRDLERRNAEQNKKA
jgi:hypothetical protein